MYFDAEDIVEQRLQDNWEKTCIDFDNVEFNPTVGDSFIRLQIEWGPSDFVSIGGLERSTGYIQISVFVPKNKSVSLINQYLDELKGIFNKWDNGKIKTKASKVRRVGEQKSWFRKDLIIPFQYDNCN